MATLADFIKWLPVLGFTPGIGASGSIGDPSKTVSITVNKGLVTALNLIAIAIASSQITDKAAANGVASLDASALLPTSQLPNIPQSKVTSLVTDLASKQSLVQTTRTVSGTATTATAADVGNVISCTNSSLCTVTLPSDTTDPNVVPGETFEIRADSVSGTVQVFPDTGVNIKFSGAGHTLFANQTLKIKKIAANTYTMVWGGSNLIPFSNVSSVAANSIMVSDGFAGITGTGAKIDSSGRMTNIFQPAFLAYNNTSRNNVTGDGTAYTIPYDGEVYDQNNNFSSGTFTSPLTGRYPLKTGTLLTNLTASYTGCVYQIVTSNRTYQIFAAGAGAMRDGNNNLIINGGIDADMDAGDTATITISVSGSTRTVNVAATLYDTVFSGYLAC